MAKMAERFITEQVLGPCPSCTHPIKVKVLAQRKEVVGRIINHQITLQYKLLGAEVIPHNCMPES